MLSIVIPTRNRPYHLQTLLGSIVPCNTSELEIIVISSGIDISDVISNFEKNMKIKHIHTEIPGQINQKLLGVNYITESSDWVMFCDDDLIFQKDFFQNLKNCLDVSSNTIGIGVSLPSTEKDLKNNILKNLFASVFFLRNVSHGAILKNGHVCSYMKSTSRIRTEWLSGASIWRSEIAKKYSSIYPHTKYAAYEDVIFSFSVSKFGLMFYCPSLKMDFQDVPTNDVAPISAFISAMCWRNYLINSDKFFSPTIFLWSQFGRNLEYLLKSKGRGFVAINRTYLHLILSNVLRKDSKKLLEKYC